MIGERVVRWSVLGWLVGGGCKPDAGGGGSTTMGSTTEVADAGAPTSGGVCGLDPAAACCCYARVEDRIATLCEVVPLCPEIEAVCSSGPGTDCASEDLEVTTVAAVDCALAALAEGKPGRIAWAIDGGGIPGEYRVSRVVDLVGDGTAFRSGSLIEDSAIDWFAVARIAVPAVDFSGCLAAPEVNARFDCVRQLATVAEDEVCIAGFSPPSG